MAAAIVIRTGFAFDEEFRGRFRSEVNRARQAPPFCTAEVLDADPEHWSMSTGPAWPRWSGRAGR
ncbi:hypothetical protein AB0J83_11795 [Actinoplanes sp. NPDC049596]|uniref:hypothetical protein n=1 Tax=unclassified Actinoplanes TaxID=2626549 RepID=UPI00341F1992